MFSVEDQLRFTTAVRGVHLPRFSSWVCTPAMQFVVSQLTAVRFGFTGQDIIDRRGIMVDVDAVQNASPCNSLAPE